MTTLLLVIMIYHLLSLQKGEALPSPPGLDLLLLVAEVLGSSKPRHYRQIQYLILVYLGDRRVKENKLLVLIMSMGLGRPVKYNETLSGLPLGENWLETSRVAPDLVNAKISRFQEEFLSNPRLIHQWDRVRIRTLRMK